MVEINNVFLGGKHNSSSAGCYNGILFWMNSKATNAKTYHIDNWDIEISSANFIIARTTNLLTNADLKTQGYSICEKALDIYSANGYGSHYIISPFERYLLITNINSTEELWIGCSETITFNLSAKLTVVDSNGNIIPPSPPQQTQWERVYSYYRYSKISNNIYDEYRWMYLVFEVIMQHLSPIATKSNGKNAESEKDWIKRALQIAESTYNWTSAVSWPTTDHITYFIDNQYDAIRCNLFHSKNGQLIPNDQISLEHVSCHLKQLESLCMHLLRKMFAVTTLDSMISADFFSELMDRTFTNSRAYISEIDVRPFGHNVTLANLSPILYLDEIPDKTVNEPRMTIRFFKGNVPKENKITMRSCGICLNDSLEIYDHSNGHTLSLVDVDSIHLIQMVRYLPQSQVKQHKQSGFVSPLQASI